MEQSCLWSARQREEREARWRKLPSRSRDEIIALLAHLVVQSLGRVKRAEATREEER